MRALRPWPSHAPFALGIDSSRNRPHWTRETTQVCAGFIVLAGAKALHGSQDTGFLMIGDSPANQSPNGQAKGYTQEDSPDEANPIRTWQQVGNPLLLIRHGWQQMYPQGIFPTCMGSHISTISPVEN
jgi:hypothetical protein